jgi:diguanylate cyclase (GGDEF)-like protein
MIVRLQPSSPNTHGRSEALQRVVTATLSATFVLVFLLLLDNLLLGQLKTRVIEQAMERMQAVQRMNYQSIQQWYSHQARHLAFWGTSPQRELLVEEALPLPDRVRALQRQVAQVAKLYPELRDVAVLDAAGKILLSSDAALMGQQSPLSVTADAMSELRKNGFVVSTLYIVKGPGLLEHRLLVAKAVTADRFVVISLSPDHNYARGPAAADKEVANYMVDPARRLYRFEGMAPQGKPFLVTGREQWYSNAGISWPSIRNLELKEGHVEWRKVYSGVGGDEVFGRWSWHAELGIGLLSEMRSEDALDFYGQVQDRVILITLVTVLMFTLALIATAILHIRLFGARSPGPVLRLWLRLAPWPWPITMLVFAIVVGAGTASSLRDFSHKGDREVASRLDSALDMTVRSLNLWREMELANVRLWASSAAVSAAVRELMRNSCVPDKVCAPQQELRRVLASLVRQDDHYGFDILTPDAKVMASSDDSARERAHLLATNPQWLARARDEHAAISGVLSSIQPLPGDHGEYEDAQPMLFVVAPIPDDTGNAVAFLALHVDPRAGFFRASEISRFGVTGDAYLVSENGVLLSKPRLDIDNDEMLSGDALLPVRLRSNSSSGEQRYRDYRGVDVIGRVYFDAGLGAYIVNKVDAAEAAAPVRSVLRAVLLIAVVSITSFAGALSAQYLSLRQRMAFQLEGAQPQRDVWARWGSHPQLMSTAVAFGIFFIDVVIVALMSRFELGDSEVQWFATSAMLTALLLPFMHLLILKPATHANMLLSQLLSRSAEQEERYRGISEQLTRANAELQRIASVDQLTGLANRRQLDDVMSYEIGRCQRSGQSLAVLMLDVDYFKRYNDSYGHTQGDEVLKTIGRLLRQCVTRVNDLAARYGGEEFCVVLPNTSTENAIRIAEEISQAIQQAQIPHDSSPVSKHITVSIGVYAAIPAVRDNLTNFYQRADKALYQAKGAGRNQVRVAVDE